MDTKHKLHVANEILRQLGGPTFKAMTGARDFVGSEAKDGNLGALHFSVPRCSKNINRVRITLESSDLYTVEFFAVRGLDCRSVDKRDGVYFDSLQEVFTRVTGLFTRL